MGLIHRLGLVGFSNHPNPRKNEILIGGALVWKGMAKYVCASENFSDYTHFYQPHILNTLLTIANNQKMLFFYYFHL